MTHRAFPIQPCHLLRPTFALWPRPSPVAAKLATSLSAVDLGSCCAPCLGYPAPTCAPTHSSSAKTQGDHNPLCWKASPLPPPCPTPPPTPSPCPHLHPSSLILSLLPPLLSAAPHFGGFEAGLKPGLRPCLLTGRARTSQQLTLLLAFCRAHGL